MSTTSCVKSESIVCKLHYKNIRMTANLSGLSQVFSRLDSAAILGANPSVAKAGRFSYWTAKPKKTFVFQSGQKNPLEKLQEILCRFRLEKCSGYNIPKGIFCGGWIGFFSYELARYIERLPENTIDDLEMPLIRLSFYDRLIAYDHQDKTIWLVFLEMEDDAERPEQKLTELENLLHKSQQKTIAKSLPVDFGNMDVSTIHCNMSRQCYLDAIEKIKRYIYDGDVYQINFSRRFESEFTADAIELFHWQNEYNPSPYSAYIDAGNFQIVSASPEMFMTITDGIISTKPIKGTRPLTDNKLANSVNYKELVGSEKEQAELNMIIDMERNDIAKICVPGTRKVTQPRTIESYPTVYHAVATVAGRLRKEVTFCDCIKAMFPGGSITGAPKIRSMEIIDQLEPTARGVYTGCIGFIGVDGSTCLNIAIRTIIIKNDKAYFQSGGGIVADSEAEAEWQETIVKAKALVAGINAVKRVLL